MKRLDSYVLNIMVFIFPIFIIGIAYVVNLNIASPADFVGKNFPVIFFISGYFFTLIKYRRVYITKSHLYIQGLLGGVATTIDKTNLVSITKLRPLNPMSYKLSFLDKESEPRTVYFFKNIFIADMNKVLKEFVV